MPWGVFNAMKCCNVKVVQYHHMISSINAGKAHDKVYYLFTKFFKMLNKWKMEENFLKLV